MLSVKKRRETQDYHTAYETAEKQLISLIDAKADLDKRILALRKTMNALATLISQEEEGFEKASDVRLMHKLDLTVTDDVLNVVSAAPSPMTSSDVLEELRKLGCTAIHHANPLATVNSILNRLHERGAVEATKKDGRKAWSKKPFGTK